MPLTSGPVTFCRFRVLGDAPKMVDDTFRHSIAEQFDKELDQVQPQTHIENELLADSLDMVEIVMDLEDQLEIAIDDEGIETCGTVTQLVDWLAPKVEVTPE